ncbi:hypothetical protein KMZ32_10725 [Phycicoccus sp. MAQZ13P-2]|uniref:hypothetical protein n=1 Tax=Phycicoccus mangrovi TaxID=2840470 RepID=UPI001BFFDEF7|nr:hypothetical protein [Phycicoccus mangrovi]MBT9255949.1 hypothetical protein [Phycicoccus mangrovi]MBT9274543.1 hypothetical protein [Phycicoccus mangrovi]
MTDPAPEPGRLLTRGALAAGLWVVLVTSLGGLAAAVGVWTPWVGWLVAVLAAVGAWVAVRGLPGVRTGVGPAVALVALVVGFAVYAGVTHSEHVLPRRDAASNLQAAISLAATGERVVPVDTSVIGGPRALEDGEVTVASAAFYQVGSAQDPAVQPQFLMAPAVVYGYGVWAGGPPAAQVLPAVVMGLVLLALGLFAAHLAGPWWGVAAAGPTAVLFPVLNVARGTYSEQLALLTLVGGLLALTLAVGRDGPGVRRLALVAGVLVGGTGLARVDALREVLLLVPFLAVGAALGQRWVRPVSVGLVASSVVAWGLALLLSYRYLGDIHASLLPLAAIAVVVLAASLGGLALWRRGRRLPGGAVRRLPDVVGALTVVVGVGLWTRPWWMTVRQDPNDPGARYVAGMQRRQGLPVDGGRTYAEHTVDWLSWYVGWAALVVALVALAVLLRRALRALGEGRLAPWAPVLVVAAGSTVLTLLRPGITPDHPWADRRLLVALPFVVVLVTVAAAWASRRLVSSGRAWGTPLVAVVTVLALGVPAVLATWPFRGVGVERGSLEAADRVCAALAPDDVVLGIDGRASSEWPQTVRGMCGRPFFVASTPVRQDPQRLGVLVEQLARGASSSGHRLVLLAADGPEAIEELGLTPRSVADLRFPEEEHALDRPPRRTDLGGVRVSVAEVPLR